MSRWSKDVPLDVAIKKVAARCAEIADRVGSDLADSRDMCAGGAFSAAWHIRREFGLEPKGKKA